MIKISKVNKTTVTSVAMRIVKVLTMGKISVNEAYESSPFGVDSNPPKGVRAIYAESMDDGVKVILGYINNKQKAETGGYRIFSVDSNGDESNDIYIRPNGDIEIGGNTDNAVKWSELNNSISQIQTDVNTQLGLIATGIAVAGGAYTPTPIAVSLTSSKSEKVKLS